MSVTVVPVDSCRLDDKTVGGIVDKPVGLGATRKKSPDRLSPDGAPASDSVIRVIDWTEAGLVPAFRPETQIVGLEATPREPIALNFVPTVDG